MNSKPALYKAFGLILTVIFLVFSVTAVISGLKLNFVDNSNRRINFEETGYFSVFVGGYVENEGFYEVRYSTTYGELFSKAKVLNHKSLSRFNYNEAIRFDEEWIVCNYENFINVNINDAKIEALVGCGIKDDDAVNIRNYIDNNIDIKNKYELVEKGLLTKEEYEKVKYKIYAYTI